LLLEHPHVYTLGARADRANVLVDPGAVGAELVEADRGGDVTYHGPGQLVGYPILTVPGVRGGGMADTVAYVASVEQLLIDTSSDLGFAGGPAAPATRASGSTRTGRAAAQGRRYRRAAQRGRSMHGFALNVDPDMAMFDHIVPVRHRRDGGHVAGRRGVRRSTCATWSTRWWLAPPMGHAAGSGPMWCGASGRGPGPVQSWRGGTVGPGRDLGAPPGSGRLAEAGVTERVELRERKPDWMRVQLRTSPDYLRLKRTMRELELVTVCEEAGCPNIYECWDDGTATFMINGERCTRACGFCLVDTRKPEPPDPAEPERVAEAVARMGLDYVVLTTVARDDLADGGASGSSPPRSRPSAAVVPMSPVEVLISDLKGDPERWQVIFDARPDVVNHNVETVPRLQRAARPSASYARSLAVLARAKAAGFTTKSGLHVGMGETFDEVVATLADLRAVGVDIVTAGQYLRPTANHLPVARWWTPDEFEAPSRARRSASPRRGHAPHPVELPRQGRGRRWAGLHTKGLVGT
jgi:lipoyl synthase